MAVPLHQWDDLVSEVEGLEKIVQNLRNRERATRNSAMLSAESDQDIPVNCHLYPTPQDPELYRVQVYVRTFK